MEGTDEAAGQLQPQEMDHTVSDRTYHDELCTNKYRHQ